MCVVLHKMLKKHLMYSATVQLQAIVLYGLAMCVYIYSGSDPQYGVVVSERLGRTNVKEQYAFLFR